MQTKAIFASALFLANLLFGANPECQELKQEFQQLNQMRDMLKKELERNKAILAKIEKEKKALQDLNQTLAKQIEQIKSTRYKKLAKDFESMDPEYAGEKLSKLKDPKIAAFILYNMNPRKAGEALNYVEPKMVSRITSILTQLEKNETK